VSELDWAGLAFNGLWVLGAAVILAAFSFTSYEAQRRGERLRVRLAAPGFHLWLSVGLMFISLGLTLLEPRWWGRVLWGVLSITNAGQLWSTWRARRTRGD
jgi:multisubunit Na+/H+ antiporter MnhB subunit